MTQVTCRICVIPEKPENCCSISPENESGVELLEMLIYCIPEMDVNIVRNPVICRSCKEALTNAFAFKKQCLSNEEKLLKYSEKYTSGAQIDLNAFLAAVSLRRNGEKVHNNNDELLVKVDTHRKRFDCNKCFGCVKKRKDPAQHIKVKCDNYTCYVCSKTFSDIAPLRKHIYVHSPKYLCKVCGRHIRDQGQMKNHLRVHTGEKPFECKYCGKKYTQKFALSDHMHIHEGNPEKNRCKCDICGRTLSSKYNLKVHMQVHDNLRPKPKRVKRKRRSKLQKIEEVIESVVKAEKIEVDDIIKFEQVILEDQYKITEFSFKEDVNEIKQNFSSSVQIKKEPDDYKSYLEIMPEYINAIKQEETFSNPHLDLQPKDELSSFTKVEQNQNIITEVQY